MLCSLTSSCSYCVWQGVSCALCVLEDALTVLINCTDPCTCSCHSPTRSGKESAMCSQRRSRKMEASHLKTFWTSWVPSATLLLWKSNPTMHSVYLVNKLFKLVMNNTWKVLKLCYNCAGVFRLWRWWNSWLRRSGEAGELPDWWDRWHETDNRRNETAHQQCRFTAVSV